MTAKQTIETTTSDLAVTAKNNDLITVTNNGGNEAENVSFVVKDGGENGNVIHTETLKTLSSGQSKDISLVEIWNKATRNDISGTKILYLEVSQEETEYELWNNSIVLEKEVAPTATPTAKPTAVPTAIPTLKPTIAPTVTPSATPDNSDKISGKKTLSKVILRVPKNKKGRKLVVRWNAVKDVKGYQLQYALNKKFKKKKSVQTKKTKYTIKKLKKKKTYYIRVRAYKMNGKKKVYGKWSTVKKVKIKK